jgi:hypothetical protein
MRETTDAAVHASPMAGADDWSRHRRGFLIATIAAPVMAVLGPLGTHEAPFWPRLLYWFLLMEAGALIGVGASSGVARWGRLKHLPVAEGALIALVISLPLTFVVASASALFFGVRLNGLQPFATMFGLVLMVSAIIVAVNYFVHRSLAAPSPEAVAPDADPVVGARTRFAERLPLPQRGLALLALEAEDHYLRVHLEGGQSALILLRLSDAIAELAALPGARTHRSWWVAKAAVARIAKADGRATLTLKSGVEAPVSRTYYRSLSEAGWLV